VLSAVAVWSRLTLRAKLWLSFAGMGLLVLVLLVLGERVIKRSVAALDEAVSGQVKPLVRLNDLQSQISRIRVQEAELPRTTDLFAMSDQVEMLDNEVRDFDRGLSQFLDAPHVLSAAERKALVDAWQRYRGDLERIGALARALDNARIAGISTYESVQRFRVLAHTLRVAAERTAAHADERLAEARRAHDSQRLLFMAISALGLVLLAAWLALLSRHLARRLYGLTRAAADLAGGQRHVPIRISGGDELARLGQAFNVLHQRVDEREAALRAAQAELESRVAARTAELHAANHALTHEVGVRRQAEGQLQHQAQYDSLTGLPNRLLALDRLRQAIRDAERGGHLASLIFIDLDDFKRVNDNFGHEAGDALLVQAASRLQQCVRGNDTVARLGGDEFVVILGGLHALNDADRVAEQVLASFGRPIALGADEFVVTPSLGLASYPGDGDDAPTLLRHADQAMYEAKAAGRNTYRYFNRVIRERSAQRVMLEGRLRGALERQEFWLALQPLVEPVGGRPVGAEALLRWRTADGQVIGPDQFIPIAESTGLIVPIGRWVIDRVCELLADWRKQGHHDLYIGINVSPRQFRDPGLVGDLQAALARHGLPGSCLLVEVTEGLLLGDSRDVRAMLEALSEMGVRLAMDDFGTGYSSLSYLKRHPFDVLKIDRSFVRDLSDDADDLALVSAAIGMGQALGMQVVAEGVETPAQLACLREMGCDLVQGYLFGTPVTAADFAARWLGSLPRRSELEAVVDEHRHRA
jgi:diguanylate cyclase (GGDEF)-like protein